MTATEELRRLLDERGVEWQAPNSCQRDEITQFRVGGDFGGTWWEAYEMSDGTFQMSSEIYDELTPEQAIAATLGRDTCKLSRGTSGLMHVTTGHCSECGAEVVKGTKDGYRSRYCQWCGAKVVGA